MPALVDVFAPAIEDPRQRYQVARAIAALGLPGVALNALQSALSTPGEPLLRRAKRATAKRILEALAARGLTGREQVAQAQTTSAAHHEARPTASGRLQVTLLLALAAVIPWWLIRTGVLDLPSSPVTTATTLPAAVAAPTAAPRPRSLTTAEIADRTLPSVVAIRCGDSIGSGFVYRATGILTNEHVCRGRTSAEIVFSDGRKHVGSVGQVDAELDVAVVRYFGEVVAARPLPIGDASTLKIGDRVVLVGSPRGLDFTVHEGRVSSLLRNHLGVGYMQFDANVNPGNSGGPLLDDQGQVVGIVSMMISGSSGLGFALPVNYVHATAGVLSPPTELWSEALRKVAAEDLKEVLAMATAFQDRFGIVAAWVDRPSDRILAVLVKRGSVEGGERVVTLEIEQDGRTRCRLEAKAEPAGSWNAAAARSQRGDPRYFNWLRKNKLADDLKLAIAEANLCGAFDKRQPFVVNLKPADPLAARVRVGPHEGGG